MKAHEGDRRDRRIARWRPAATSLRNLSFDLFSPSPPRLIGRPRKAYLKQTSMQGIPFLVTDRPDSSDG